MAKEFELKYQASPEILEEIQGNFSGFTPISMETTYFDTPDGAMKARRWTLRRRLENGTAVCSLKTPGDFIRRGEWEAEGEDILTLLPVLCQLGAPEELLSLTASGISPVCGARFTRLAARIQLEAGEVELALDQGVFLGGGRQVPFAEVEVELKEGTEEAALAFAGALAERFHLTPETRGKVERAMALGESAVDGDGFIV